ncbi:MAG: hypothetical protein ACREV1_11870 [Gammaproteobacteria bacterium]
MSTLPAVNLGSFLSALHSARDGIDRGLAGLARDAHEIARSSVGVDNGIDAVSAALVDSLQNRLLVQASAKILYHTDETLGALLDTRA